MISIDDFKKVEIAVGEILSAEKVPETDKLLKLSVDFGLKPTVAIGSSVQDALGVKKNGEENPPPAITPAPPLEKGELGTERDVRQIISGIALYYPNPVTLVGKKCLFVTNLEPRAIKGLESKGMIVAVSAGEAFSLAEIPSFIPAGTKAK